MLLTINTNAQSPLFSKYPVSLYRGTKAKLILKSNPLGYMFKTMISDTYYSKSYMKSWHESAGLNFGGHYCFAYWGCGSPCQAAVVVDIKTGIIYDAPAASYGYDFKPTSRLVIVNPGDLHTGCAGCTTEYWLWNDQLKKFMQIH